MAVSVISSIAIYFSRYTYLILAVLASVLLLITILYILRLKYRNKIKRLIMDRRSAAKPLSLQECKTYMKELARQHKVIKLQKHNKYFKNVNQILYMHFCDIRTKLENASPKIISLIPAARWLFDNSYLLFQELRKSDEFRFNRIQQPILYGDIYKNFPRVYIVAQEMVNISGTHLNEETIYAMMDAYQSIEPLTSAELWMLLDIINLCLLQDIANVSRDIISVVQTKIEADRFVRDNLLKLFENPEIKTIPSVKPKKEHLLNANFISHILYCLKSMSVDETQIVQLLEQWSDQYDNPKSIIANESRFEAGLESVIRTVITSIREIKNINGEDFFERLSPIEAVLKNDPAGVYEKMDFDTRRYYRIEVERLSRKYKMSEQEMARTVLRVTEAVQCRQDIGCPDHVGTYLVGQGAYLLKNALSGKNTAKPSGSRKIVKITYGCSIILFSLAFLAFLAWCAIAAGHPLAHAGIISLLALALLPAIGIGIELSNAVFTRLVPIRVLPCLDFLKEIPDECRTFIVMPVILHNAEQAKKYAANLEKYYFANMQPNLYFAILADFADAPGRTMPQDEEILKAASRTIHTLNNRYHYPNARFMLFFRYRKWNESEGCWMGWERKRGKLEEFNAMLCGDKSTSFSLIEGDESILHTFHYIITLDADTDLIRDSAAKLIGTLAHPLNRPSIDYETNKVKSGYAIIQSEIRNHIFDASGCLFSKTFAGQQGLDPYSNIIADIYQDTFGEGIFVGKGIYDLKAMHRILHGAFPENSVLSHDLLESCYARCAFSSGIKLMDTYPSSVFSYTKREHRWIRGDWQLLPWLFGRGNISGISKWKIFDNLRRSLVPFFRLAVMAVSLLLLPDLFYLWIPVVFFSDIFHIVFTLIKTLAEKVRRPIFQISWRGLGHSLFNILKQSCFGFILMPYRACVAADAITRTVYRLAFSRKHLLQWQTMESLDAGAQKTLSGYYAVMWAVLFPVLTLLGVGFLADSAPAMVLCFLIAALWAVSPVFAFLLSRSTVHSADQKLKEKDKHMLRLLARRNWQFFKDYSVPENNWLCPDNYQVSPSAKLSDKTSPTNIGLQLLSTLSARDFGYLGLLKFLEYCENILYTVSVLPKWHGHLYNWYDVRTLEILTPKYISTVDSGNFTSYIITLRNGLLSMLNQPVFSASAITGIQDTIALAGLDVSFCNEYATVSDFIQSVYELEQSIRMDVHNPWENEKYKSELKELCGQYLQDAAVFGSPYLSFDGQHALRHLIADGNSEIADYVKKINGLARTLHHIAKETNFKALFNPKRLLFHIGYHEASKTPDSSYYDLMASESALTSLLAIARGDAPKKHWFYLARPLTIVHGIPVFVAWSGTMFEYLMPGLVMREHQGSVFHQTATAAVLEQIRYAKKMKIPWGMSESQYFRFDINSNYQYKAFGVPKLKLQPSAKASLVIAPYATFLAMHLRPKKSVKNLRKLQELDALGEYGLYEALDFNSPDPQNLRPYSIVRCFMAHHQGMSLVSVDNLLNGNIMQKRFHSEPMIRAAEILLEEMRGSNVIPVERKGYSIMFKEPDIPEEPMESRFIKGIMPAYPSAHWLSNRQYSLLLTSDGDGFSKYQDIMVNRWRSDRYASAGSYVYIRDLPSKQFWSAAYKPALKEPDEYQVEFAHYKAEYKRRDGDIESHMDITLSPNTNYELRRITVINNGHTKRQIEITSYIEVVFDAYLAEMAHPRFSKLFIESEYSQKDSMLICRNRKLAAECKTLFLAHMVKTNSPLIRNVEFETDRLRFLGRNNSPDTPLAMLESFPLSSRAGFSVDPVLSLRVTLSILPGQTASVTFMTGVFSSRKEAFDVSTDLGESFRINHVFEQFRMNSELEMKYLSVNSQKINAYQDLVGPIFYSFMPFRGPEESIRNNWKNQSFLWRYGISGDIPILIMKVKSIDELDIVKDVLRAYEYFRINMLRVDLIILNEEPEGYMQNLDNILVEMISSLKVYNENIAQPSLFILRKSRMEEKDLNLLFAVACIVFSDKTGIYFKKTRESFWEENAERLSRPRAKPLPPPPYSGTGVTHGYDDGAEFSNNIGCFVGYGTEYKIHLSANQKPPKPWINVIANDRFGFQISETGAGYTWSLNSRENKLTAWSNDPVTDPVSEAVYIFEPETGKTYLPAPLGNVKEGGYSVRHGFGYSVFETQDDELGQEMTVFADAVEPVRIWQIALHNKTGRKRRLELSLYALLTIGVDRGLTHPYIVTDFDPELGCFIAKSVYIYEFRKYMTFLFSSEKIISHTGDREEFFGSHPSIYSPEGLAQPLSGRTGAGLDPCGVIRIALELEPGETKNVLFGLGNCDDVNCIARICFKYRDIENSNQSLRNVREYWKKITHAVTVSTGNRALDILANGWLLYQTLVCRIKARAALYQCGGAFGFRDQLQDSLALLDAQPDLVRDQILLACSRQFEEGDVQHWWHPPSGLGVRTRISDDLLWLPYVTAAYITHTEDYAVLNETVPYINAPPLREDEHEAMITPTVSESSSGVYDHCIRAILRVRFGEHGLPLMGGGDWNDGMNRVGLKGKGESIWLGWFLYAVYMEFAPLCRRKGEDGIALEFESKARELAENLENHAWDGEWYLRAYYDDGQKMGSMESYECRIDSISQSWSAISGAAERGRALQALYSARKYLVHPREGVSLLLTPAFDKTPNDPGYIKNYYPGIRENGGQYTHAAIWLAIAHMAAGECGHAYDLLNMLNPIYATSSLQGAMKYEKEPYVMSADISMNPNYMGCAGWSWYTGSSSWMYQAILRWFLGIRRQGGRMVIDPAVPATFGAYTVYYSFGDSMYLINVREGFNAGSPNRVTVLDDTLIQGNSFDLVDDRKQHYVTFYSTEER